MPCVGSRLRRGDIGQGHWNSGRTGCCCRDRLLGRRPRLASGRRAVTRADEGHRCADPALRPRPAGPDGCLHVARIRQNPQPLGRVAQFTAQLLRPAEGVCRQSREAWQYRAARQGQFAFPRPRILPRTTDDGPISRPIVAEIAPPHVALQQGAREAPCWHGNEGIFSYSADLNSGAVRANPVIGLSQNRIFNSDGGHDEGQGYRRTPERVQED